MLRTPSASRTVAEPQRLQREDRTHVHPCIEQTLQGRKGPRRNTPDKSTPKEPETLVRTKIATLAEFDSPAAYTGAEKCGAVYTSGARFKTGCVRKSGEGKSHV